MFQIVASRFSCHTEKECAAWEINPPETLWFALKNGSPWCFIDVTSGKTGKTRKLQSICGPPLECFYVFASFLSKSSFRSCFIQYCLVWLTSCSYSSQLWVFQINNHTVLSLSFFLFFSWKACALTYETSLLWNHSHGTFKEKKKLKSNWHNVLVTVVTAVCPVCTDDITDKCTVGVQSYASLLH